MKRLVLLLLIWCVSILSFSQDEIITKNRIKINCKISKEDSTTVYFNYYNKGEELETYLNKNQIASYKYGAVKVNYFENDISSNAKAAFSAGFYQGGGSIIGIDLEALFLKRLGVQVGGGFGGFGAGVNFHLKPRINSTSLSIQYWNRINYAKYLGPTIIYRGRSWLTAQLGVAKIFDKNPDLEEEFSDDKYAILYSIGAYFPLEINMFKSHKNLKLNSD
jgi:hypothetical protein